MRVKIFMPLFLIFAVLISWTTGLSKTNFPPPPVESATGPEYATFSLLEKAADRHAYNIWGENIGRGKPLPLTDMTGKLIAYVFPYALHEKGFPELNAIFENVRNARNLDQTKNSQNSLSELTKKFGSIYVSATKKNHPIPRVDHSLHVYFLNGEIAQQKANDYFGQQAELRHLVLANVCDQYFEFTSRSKTIFIDAYSLEITEPDQINAVDFNSAKDPTLEKLIASSWLDLENKVAVNNEMNKTTFLTEKLLDYIDLVPPLIWTLNCATTAKAMVLSYWDHYVPGVGTFTGFGRLVDFWYEHPSNGKNVPNLIEEVHAANGIDPWQVNNYTCNWTEVSASSNNNWSWQEFTNEIDNDRPTCWSISGHTMTGIGYRIDSSNPANKWAIVYNTWDTNQSEYIYTDCVGVACIEPTGGDVGMNSIITEPYGGEAYWIGVPAKISWHVWGQNINKTNISWSSDAGNNWQIIDINVPTKEDVNHFRWIPGVTTQKGRVSIQSFLLDTTYIAGDGSYQNFVIEQVHSSGSWLKISGPVDTVLTGYDISTGTRCIYVTDYTTGEIFQFVGEPGVMWEWVKIGQPGKKFALAASGQLFGLSLDGKAIYHYTGTPMQWEQIGNEAGEIFSDTDGVLATNPQTGDIYRYLGTPFSWEKIGGPGKTFVTDAEGFVYGLAPDGSSVWRYDNLYGQWEKIGGPAENLYGRGLGVYATNPTSGEIYFFTGAPFHWKKIGGAGKTFSVDVYGQLYGLSPAGDVVSRCDGYNLTFDTYYWTHIGGAAGDVYAGWLEILAKNPQTHELYIYGNWPTSVEKENSEKITSFSLKQNYPNPFNPKTLIPFQLSKPSKVTLKIFNIMGQEMITLVDDYLPAGKHKIYWNGLDKKGRNCASGIYLYKLATEDKTEVRKMMLMR